MINPHEPTNFQRSLDELQEWLLFGIVVAGKNAEQQALKLDQLLRKRRCAQTPFEFIQGFDFGSAWLLEEYLREVKLGKYTLLLKALPAAAQFSEAALRSASTRELAHIPGVSLKTAKMFILHSRPNQFEVPLDTWVLRYLRQRYPQAKVPEASPQREDVYEMLESLFLADCFRHGVSVAEADINCWRSRGQSIHHNHHARSRGSQF